MAENRREKLDLSQKRKVLQEISSTFEFLFYVNTYYFNALLFARVIVPVRAFLYTSLVIRIYDNEKSEFDDL